MAIIGSRYFSITPLRKERSFVPTPDHICPTCHSPIYSKYPVCGKCFQEGKFPKTMWKLYQHPVSSPRRRSLKSGTNSRRKRKWSNDGHAV